MFYMFNPRASPQRVLSVHEKCMTRRYYTCACMTISAYVQTRVILLLNVKSKAGLAIPTEICIVTGASALHH